MPEVDAQTTRAVRHLGLARRCRVATMLIAALALGLTLAGCDHCGDWFWQQQHSCKTTPPPR